MPELFSLGHLLFLLIVFAIASIIKGAIGYGWLRRWAFRNGLEIKSAKIRRIWLPNVHTFDVTIVTNGVSRNARVTLHETMWRLDKEDLTWLDQKPDDI